MIISLTVNWLSLPMKRTRWLNGLKKQDLPLYATHRRLASDVRTHRDGKWYDRKTHSGQKKAGEATLLSEKISL